MVFGINEDRVVRTRSHAGFASDTDRLVEIDYAIGTSEHSRSRTGRDARRVRTLVASCDLMRTPGLREHTNIDMLDIRTGDREWDIVLGLTGSRARVTADTARVVNNLGPLDRLRLL